MTTSHATRYCEHCEERTRHEVERNRETGWHRQRCQTCGAVETITPHGGH